MVPDVLGTTVPGSGTIYIDTVHVHVLPGSFHAGAKYPGYRTFLVCSALVLVPNCSFQGYEKLFMHSRV